MFSIFIKQFSVIRGTMSKKKRHNRAGVKYYRKLKRNGGKRKSKIIPKILSRKPKKNGGKMKPKMSRKEKKAQRQNFRKLRDDAHKIQEMLLCQCANVIGGGYYCKEKHRDDEKEYVCCISKYQ